MILMHWKLTVGTQAKVQHLVDSLHNIDLHWLAGKIYHLPPVLARI